MTARATAPSNPSTGRGVIYCARNLIDGKRYIGQTVYGLKYRRAKHEYLSTVPDNSNHTYFHRALAKHGLQNFEWTELVTCEPTAEVMDHHEIRLIREHQTLRPRGYNIREGGSGREGVRTAGYKRKREEDEELPVHISCYRNTTSGREGYQVGLPCGRCRLIVSSRLTMSEKLQMAIEWKRDFLAGIPMAKRTVTRRNSRDDALPQGISVQLYKTQMTYRVNMPGIRGRGKCFGVKSGTAEERLQKALAYRKSLLNGNL